MKLTYRCDACAEDFVNEKWFVAHSTLVHCEPKPFQCTICSKKFTQRGNLRVHVNEIHLEVKRFQCTVCPSKFSRKKQIVRHLQKVHAQNPEKSCQIDNRTTSKTKSRRKSVKHEPIVKGKYAVSETPTKLAPHMRSHPIQQPFKCTKCPMRFVNKSYMLSHMQIHGAKKHRCQLCPFATHRIHSLSDHVRRHNNERPFNCTICTMSFSAKSDVRHHMRRHAMSNTKEKQNIPKVGHTKVRGHKNRNVAASQKLPKRHQCAECDKSFSKKCRLANHVQRYHAVQVQHETEFACKICAEPFLNEEGLATHVQIHTGETFYSCLMPGKEFHASEPLEPIDINKPGTETAQTQSEESGSEGQQRSTNYTCPFCDLGFNCMEEFGCHVRIHTKEDTSSSTCSPLTPELRVILNRIVIVKTSSDSLAVC